MPARRVPPTVLKRAVDVALPLDEPQPPPTPPAQPQPARRRTQATKPDCPGDNWAGWPYWHQLWNSKKAER